MDCSSNIDNRILKPIYDEISKIAFTEKFNKIFHSEKVFFRYQILM